MTDLLRWFSEPYGSSFMRNAGLVAVLIGILAPTVGVWVVLRRIAYLGDAMSHGTLSGVAAAYFAGINVAIGALCAGLLMGLLVALLERQRRVSQDSAIGVIETLLFAAGVLLISRNDRAGVDLTHFLFGQIVTADRSDLAVNAALTSVALMVVAVLFDDLRTITFDAPHARQVGVNVRALQLALIVLISITVVVSLDTVGLLMSVALLITPAATARLLTNRVETMTALAVVIGVSSALGGLTLSYHLATPPGPTIAVATVAWFTGAIAVGRPLGRFRHPMT
ncbi:MAG: metal ABC transporter permease [Acidimicrobiales bacterium]|nr:metal ABC transporter permease [Acidimicrobiales bacterium]